jgi:hypothetical protein
VRVVDIEQSEHVDGLEWRARVVDAGEDRVLRFGGPAALVADADATMFLAATLLPAMAWGQDLHVEGPVSARVLGCAGTIARSFAALDPSLRVPGVTASSTVEPSATSEAVACLFSRGVDSTYSAAVERTHPGPIDALVHCRTLEPVHDDASAAVELQETSAAAERLGLPLQEVWTDLRAFTDPMFGWSAMHGSGLAALAHLVGSGFGHVVIPSAYDVHSLSPAGSHPAIDPLWSSARTTVHHDHLDRNRHEKVRWLVEHRPDLLATLKICYSVAERDNCGRCHKCLLTMSSLRAEGALHLASRFPQELDLDAVRRQRIVHVGVRQLWPPIVRRAREVGDVELAEALEDALRLTAVPTLREQLGGRWSALDRAWTALAGPPRHPPYDPERATTFEAFDRVHTDAVAPLVRHGEVRPLGVPAPARQLRAGPLAAAVEASVRHRLASRRRGRATG